MNGNLNRVLIMKDIFGKVFLMVTVTNLHDIVKHIVPLCYIYLKCPNLPHGNKAIS